MVINSSKNTSTMRVSNSDSLSKNHKTQMRISKSDCLSKNHKNSSQISKMAGSKFMNYVKIDDVIKKKIKQS